MSMKIKVQPISDLGLAAWLSFKKHELVNIFDVSGKKFFNFRNTPQLSEDIHNFLDDKPLELVPRYLLSEFRQIKSLLHREKIIVPIDEKE